MNIKNLLCQACLIMLMMVLGCSSPVTPTVTGTSTFPSTETLATSTSSSLSPTPNLTQFPDEISSTPTTFSPLSGEEAIEKLLELLEDNGGCQLPCFLGYTPGTTTTEEIDQFFEQFSVSQSSDIEISKSQDTNTQAVRFYFPQENLYFNAGISSWENKDENQIVIMGMGTFLTGLTEHAWSSSYYEVVKYYMLPQILAEYGKPSEVLILTYRDDRQRPDVKINEFFLVLLYSEQGIYLKYKMERQVVDSSFLGCPLEAFVDVAVWDHESPEAFDQVVEIMNNGGDLLSYKSIDEATAMSTNEFYETFKDPKSRECIETPIEIWPNP